MSTAKLALVPVIEEIGTCQAVFHECGAAQYLDMNRTAFRELVFSGRIPYTSHLNGVRRIYLRSDLDAYLAALKRRTMPPRGNSPRPAQEKGANKP
jgi:hypothetical protein